MDISELVGIIDNHLGVVTLMKSVASIKDRVGNVERKFCRKEGAINLMHGPLDHMEAMHN